MQRVVPALRVFDYSISRAFYERLGFTEQWRHQFEDGLPIFACVARSGMEINLTEHEGDCQPRGLVHFYVPDIDSLFEEYRDREVPITQPPRNSLGPDLRDMLIIDPDGNRLSFITITGDAG